MRQMAIAFAGLVVVVAAVVLGLFLWLRTYAPLLGTGSGTFGPGPGLGADVEPTAGSGGKTVYIPIYRKDRQFRTTFTLHNTGRFAVTVTGLAGHAAGELWPESVTTLRLDPHQSALVEVDWRMRCSSGGSPAEVSADHVPLRYRYLSLFRRTQSVELPFAVTLRCSGGPPASP